MKREATRIAQPAPPPPGGGFAPLDPPEVSREAPPTQTPRGRWFPRGSPGPLEEPRDSLGEPM